MALRILPGTLSDHMTTLLLEGSVTGPWVAVLDAACKEALSNVNHVTLDLGGVSYLDFDGIAVLRKLMDHAVSLVNCSPFTSMQLRGDTDGWPDNPKST